MQCMTTTGSCRNKVVGRFRVKGFRTILWEVVNREPGSYMLQVWKLVQKLSS